MSAPNSANRITCSGFARFFSSAARGSVRLLVASALASVPDACRCGIVAEVAVVGFELSGTDTELAASEPVAGVAVANVFESATADAVCCGDACAVTTSDWDSPQRFKSAGALVHIMVWPSILEPA
jgi:hypothetical protein